MLGSIALIVVFLVGIIVKVYWEEVVSCRSRK